MTLLFAKIAAGTLAPSRAGQESANSGRHWLRSMEREITNAGGLEIDHDGVGSMGAFSTASAALECAVAMQRTVDGDNRARGSALGLAIGLSGGEVILDEHDDFGDPIIEAARLCQRASGGKILAARIVKDTAGRRTPYPYRFVGRIELEGLPEPVEVFEVGWEPAPPAVSSALTRPM